MKVTAQILIAYHARKFVKRRREAKIRYEKAKKEEKAIEVKRVVKSTGGNPSMLKPALKQKIVVPQK